MQPSHAPPEREMSVGSAIQRTLHRADLRSRRARRAAPSRRQAQGMKRTMLAPSAIADVTSAKVDDGGFEARPQTRKSSLSWSA